MGSLNTGRNFSTKKGAKREILIPMFCFFFSMGTSVRYVLEIALVFFLSFSMGTPIQWDGLENAQCWFLVFKSTPRKILQLSPEKLVLVNSTVAQAFQDVLFYFIFY